ncbi:hypothetical protein NC652_017930 [Populus alba x Populus x berolinensis]|nr:hypothetical protein NC652_017930 [Populus alba x Populus x berolinensis]
MICKAKATCPLQLSFCIASLAMKIAYPSAPMIAPMASAGRSSLHDQVENTVVRLLHGQWHLKLLSTCFLHLLHARDNDERSFF